MVLLATLIFSLTHPAQSETRTPQRTLEQENLDHQLLTYSKTGGLSTVQELVKRGANINRTNLEGRTPLMVAALYGNFKVVNYLLQQGAEVNVRDDYDNTALHLSMQTCSVKSAQSLLKNRVDYNWKNSHLATPLMYAAERGCGKIVEMMVTLPNLDTNSTDVDYKSALDYAQEGFTISGSVQFEEIIHSLKRSKSITVKSNMK